MSLVLLVEQWDDRYKSRRCVDGSKHSEKIGKEEYASPRVALEIIMITPSTKDNDDYDMATRNITGMYLHKKNDDYVIMLLIGILEELIGGSKTLSKI